LNVIRQGVNLLTRYTACALQLWNSSRATLHVHCNYELSHALHCMCIAIMNLLTRYTACALQLWTSSRATLHVHCNYEPPHALHCMCIAIMNLLTRYTACALQLWTSSRATLHVHCNYEPNLCIMCNYSFFLNTWPQMCNSVMSVTDSEMPGWKSLSQFCVFCLTGVTVSAAGSIFNKHLTCHKAHSSFIGSKMTTACN